MKPYKDTKIVIIGFGFLMGYLEPCYTHLVGTEQVKEQIVAVTADEATLNQKRELYPFPILLNDNKRALEEMKPDIIFFAPPPTVAPGLARDVLKPYYDARRAAGETLPDLYAFPPSPQGKFYLDLLGADIHVCNILPNMMREINGISLNGAEGNSNITIPAEGPWPEENLRRLEEVFSPIGSVVYVPTENVLDMLASLCVIEVVPLMLYNLADATGLNAQDLASAMRGYHQQIHNYHPKGCTPCAIDAVPESPGLLLKQIRQEWMDAMTEFLIQVGMSRETAEKILVSNLDLKLHCCQLQDRAKTEDDLRNHATKGGVAERARKCYELLLEPMFIKRFRELPALLQDRKFFTLCHTIASEICKIVASHARKLDGDSGNIVLKPDHSAMLFTLFVRNAREMAGQAGAEAAHQGLLLYADQRGSRMAKRAAAHGDPNTMINYMVYGEWSPLPGTMEQENVALTPAVVTHVSVCPWYTVWERFGFLSEGEEYCRYIDYNLVKGYNRDLELGVTKTRTCGGDCCEFIWNGCVLDEENSAYLARRKAELGDSCKMDWVYHTRHTYSAMKGKLAVLENAGEIVAKTMQDFETLYGAAARKCIEDCEHIDFYEI